MDVRSLYGFKNNWSHSNKNNLAQEVPELGIVGGQTTLLKWHGDSLDLDGTNSRCFLVFLLPGSNYTRHYAPCKTSWN